jgi:hypothetical protein
MKTTIDISKRTKGDELITKYADRIMIDYPEMDKIYIDLTQFENEVLISNNHYKLVEALKMVIGDFPFQPTQKTYSHIERLLKSIEDI